MAAACSNYDLNTNASSSLRDTYESCSWMSFLLIFPTVLINLSIIIALATSTERTKPCFILLINLAVTDLFTGLINMPTFFVIFRYTSDSKDPCVFARFSIPVFLVFGCTSFITIAWIAVERYISIFHPFYHVSQLNPRKVTICVGLSWLIPMPPMVTSLSLHDGKIFKTFSAVLILAGIGSNVFCYFRILKQARSLRFRIQNEAARYGRASITANDRRFLSIGGLIITSMFICITPAGVYAIMTTLGYTGQYSYYSLCWVWTLVLANSLINPVITCIFSPTIRSDVLRIMRCKIKRQTAVNNTNPGHERRAKEST